MVSEAVTNQIRVQVKSYFVPERSKAELGKFVYAYRIRITNEGDQAAQLLTRHWIITDGFGNVEEVRGPGVVGQQPRIAPGDTHEYTSYCPLPTQFGTMQGAFNMIADDGTRFQADVAQFRLFIPALNN